jgi:hypothetical protein
MSVLGHTVAILAAPDPDGLKAALAVSHLVWQRSASSSTQSRTAS